MLTPRRKPVRAPLTPREFQVLELVASGLENAEICVRLGIAKRSVGEHVGNLTRKLQARNKPHAVAIAYRRGLLKTYQPLPAAQLRALAAKAETVLAVDEAESGPVAALRR